MEYDVILTNIHKALSRKYPSGASKNNILRKVLDLDKMGAYRRLNGMVHFKVNEVATLCSALELPVEGIFNLPKNQTIALNLLMTNYSRYSLEDRELHAKAFELIGRGSRSEKSKFVISTNMLPHNIISGYDYLVRLCLCKWLYFNNETGINIPFRDTQLAEVLREGKKLTAEYFTHYKNMVIIWDQRVIETTLEDMRYFYRINILTGEEVEKLREELHQYINYMDALATRGCHAETGNQVDFYISSLSLDCNYGFIDSDDVKASIIQAFILNIGWTENTDSFDYVKTWMNTLIRSSTLVSTSGELARVEFFNKQRKLIDSFKV